MVRVKPLAWTDESAPTESCRYNHVEAMTPFGRFGITWKGWKGDDWPTVDEVPWEGYDSTFGPYPTLEDAKAACEQEFARRINESLSPEPGREE